MKKIFAFAASLLLAVGCTAPTTEENINNNENGEYDVLYAAVDNEASKVLIDAANDLSWNAGDQISVWNKNDLQREFTFQGEDGEKAGEFKGKFVFGTGTPIDAVYAVYPYAENDNLSYENLTITSTIPAEQTYREGTIASGAAIMTAIAEDKNALQFKNAMSFLRVQLTGEGSVKSVAITANSKEALAGKVTISHDENNIPAFTVAEEGASSTLTLNCGEGVELGNETTTFWMAVRPVTLATGFTLTVTTTENVYTFPAEKADLTFERNQINKITRVCGAESQTIYFVPGVWETDSAWFAAYFFNTTPSEGSAAPMVDSPAASTMWVKMTDSDADGIYECQAPEGYNSVIFCRMNSADTTEMSFSNAWNQTANITIDTDNYESNNHYYVTGWNQEDGNWGEKPAPAVWCLVGSFNGWVLGNAPEMTATENNWYVIEDVELFKGEEFKFAKNHSWDENYGDSISAEVDTEYTLQKGGQNIKATKNGKFDIYFNATTKAFKYTCVEDYNNITVNITIDNKANWSPLYIYLEDAEGNAITPAEGALVSDNVYAVSGSYIGEALTCKFISGSKVSEDMNVSITKNGATVVLEETIIKLTITLDTDNSKQWWGNTAKIHVWGTGTSFDTSWPGNAMTNEGNYTWSIIVPSELVGKTISYLIHNGNGWQSSDSTITISAEGNTVTGSSIGIN